MKKTITILTFCWLFSIPIKAQLINLDELETDTVSDADGNVYTTILFNETWWLSTNLRTKHYNDGSSIQAYENLSSLNYNTWYPYWCGTSIWSYPELDSSKYDTYGLLYTWYAAADEEHGGICPEGWSITDTSDWFNLGRLIVGNNYITWETGTRNTPDGGTETYYEITQIDRIGRFLKTDNGNLWTHEPLISSKCNEANMNIVPSGKVAYSVTDTGTLADFWTGVYVHDDSSGLGRRYLHFDNISHTMSVSWNHNANMQCVRCVKDAHILILEASSIVLDRTAKSVDTISVTANYNWEAKTNASWFSVSQSVDSADGEIVITTLSTNYDLAARTDTVFVTMNDAKTKTILVTQAGKDFLFSVSDTSLKVNASEGSSTVFSISSNVNWTISSSETWITTSVTSGSGNVSVTLTAEANTDTIIRLATVTIESEMFDTAYKITIIQSAKVVQPSTSALLKTLSEENIKIYPNPVNTLLHISSGSKVLQVDIISLNGKIVLSQPNATMIDMENLKAGMYLSKITTVNDVYIRKLVKR